jgi:hypothetical protein
MTEHVLSIFVFENRQILAEYLLIISISYIAVIIAIVYVGQRTRIITPLTRSKIMCRPTACSEKVFTRHRTVPDNIKYRKVLKKKLI